MFGPPFVSVRFYDCRLQLSGVDVAHDSRSDDGVAPLGVRAAVGRAFRPDWPVQNKVRQAAALENGKQPWCRVGKSLEKVQNLCSSCVGRDPEHLLEYSSRCFFDFAYTCVILVTLEIIVALHTFNPSLLLHDIDVAGVIDFFCIIFCETSLWHFCICFWVQCAFRATLFLGKWC